MDKWIEKNIFWGNRPYVLILTLGFFTYAQSLFFNFTYLDDNSLILDNFGFISHLSNFFQAFRQDVFLSLVDSYYRPIMTLSLMLDAQIGGNSPFIYHFSNIVIHLISACLLFLIFKKLNYRRELSLFFALVFAVIPVLSQAVGWVPGRNDSLLALFIFSAFIFFLKFIESKKKSHFAAYAVFFALALFTKETSISLIPVQLFYLYFIEVPGKFFTSKKYKFWLRIAIFWKNSRLFLVGWGVISMFWLYLRHAAFVNPLPMSFSIVIKSIFVNFPAAIQLIGKIIFPFNLSVLPIIQDTTFIYGIISLFLILGLLFFTRSKRWNYLAFGALWFFLFLLPSFIRPNMQIVSDFIEHRLYLPILGLFIVLMELNPIRKLNLKKKNQVLLLVIVLLALSSITIVHSRNFSDRISFWRNAASHSPHSPLAHRNLGAMYYLDKNPDEAKVEFEKALKLNSSEVMAHNNLGLIYMDAGDFAKAEEEYDKELEINPYYDHAYANKAILYYKEEKFEEALEAWEKTLEINPTYSEALYNLFVYYYQKQDKENALYWAKQTRDRGVPILPEMQNILNPLGGTLNLPLRK